MNDEKYDMVMIMIMGMVMAVVVKVVVTKGHNK